MSKFSRRRFLEIGAAAAGASLAAKTMLLNPTHSWHRRVLFRQATGSASA